MIPAQAVKDQKLAILGLARSGISAARAINAGGGMALCWDDDPRARSEAEAAGLTLCDLTKASSFDGVSRVILSPGIAHLYPEPHPIVRAAISANIPVDNDIGLFFASLGTDEWDELDPPPKVVAVTGSNGKSTVAALIHHILSAAGRPVQIGGNFGRAVFDLNPPVEGEIIVLELSSYQCELARVISPDIAVFTNFSTDHFKRHGGRGGYFAAKARLFHQGGPERAVIGIDEVEGQFLANQFALWGGDECVLPISMRQKLTGAGWNFFVRKGFLVEYRKARQAGSWDLRDLGRLVGAHNHQNAACAVAVLRSLHVPPRAIEAGLKSFEGLPHRCQRVAEGKGVVFINDSKATNVASTIAALQSFDKIRWIVGGEAKEGGLSGIGPYLDSVEKAYLIGASAKAFSNELGDFPHQISTTLEAGVRAAMRDSRPGETILFAPAAASWDQFENFEERGVAFTRLAYAVLGQATNE